MSRGGRPTVEREAHERVPMSTRIRGSLFNRLTAEARSNDRPLGNEVELRLEQSFARKSLFGEALKSGSELGLAGLMVIAGRVMQESARSRMNEKHGGLPSGSWLADPDAYDEAVNAALAVLDEFRPTGTPERSNTPVAFRFAAARISEVVNTGAPYPFGEQEWIDLARECLGPDMIAQSRWLRAQHEEDAAILAARGEIEA